MSLYCPTCKAKYPDSIAKCKKCHEPLKPASEIPPFCHICKKTYDDAEAVCADCLVELTRYTGAEKDQGKQVYVDMVTVYETSNIGEIAALKGALEAEEIAFNARDEISQSLFGLGLVGGYNPFTGGVKIDVDSSRKDEALAIIKNLVEQRDDSET